EYSPLGYFSGAVCTLKFGDGGRSTLTGGSWVPCAHASRALPGASSATAKGTMRWYTVGTRFMGPLSRRAMRVTLNNTVVFVGQALRRAIVSRCLTSKWAVIVLAVSLAAPGLAGCRHKKSPTARQGSSTDLT